MRMKFTWLAGLALGGLLQLAGSVATAQEAAVDHAAGRVLAREVCSRSIAPGQARCHALLRVDGRQQPLVSATPSGYGPSDLRAAYGITAVGASSSVIAIVDAYHYANAESDLATYRAQFGLPPCTKANGCFKQVDQNGGTSYPSPNTGWNQEAALDLDMASAMCPQCSIVLVEAKSSTLKNLATAVSTASRLAGVRAISNSYGGSESGSAAYESFYDHPGIAVTASTGDSGYGAQFPAGTSHVIAVGGTSLQRSSTPRGWSETAWSGAGSGCSSTYAKPSWQTDTGCSMRAMADVSAVADPATGVAVYAPLSARRSGWVVFGGTSVSAPLIAGIYAAAGVSANYSADPYAHPASFNDVVSGSNGSCGGSYLCTAGPGYDGPTGLGTPNTEAGF